MASSIPLRLCTRSSRYLLSRFVGLHGGRSMACSIDRIYGPRTGPTNSSRLAPISGFHTSTQRWKKKSKKGKPEEDVVSTEEEEGEEDEEEAEEEEYGADYRLMDLPVAALRVDTVAKVGLGIARSAVEQLMYEGKIRVDGKLCRKKGAVIDVGTTIDQLLEASPDNADFTNIKRLLVVKIHDRTDNQGRLLVKVKKWASLTVDDYKITSAAKDDEAT